MSEHPILFSAPMVRAILDGRKTMTRRVIRDFPTTGYRWCGWIVENGTKSDTGKATIVPEGNMPYMAQGQIKARCPYGQPGDRLWVREMWRFVGIDMLRHGRTHHVEDAIIEYKDGTRRTVTVDWKIGEDYLGRGEPRWRPSIHMPRWASRILLEVTAVRIERLQDISEEDARAEGAEAKRWQDLRQCPMSLLGGVGSALPAGPRYRYGFFELWNSINNARGFGWDENPWVWVIEFKKI
jgi:hypothetical protein